MTLSLSRNLCLGLGLAALLAGCSTPNPYQVPERPHHTATGFRNNDIGTVSKSFGDLVRWLSERQFFGDTPVSLPTPTAAPDLAGLRRQTRAGPAAAPSVTWIGHATTLVQAGGLTVLTDPMFSQRASPVSFIGPQRRQPPGIALADLPHVDVVVVSHNHFDHLDEASVVALAAQAGGAPLFLVPLGVKGWLQDLGVSHVVELDWWQSHRVGDTEFFLTPVQHWSGRSWGDRHRSLWGGWAVFHRDFQWYFSGDTGYSGDFVRTRERFADRQRDGGFDLALIAIGAYEPHWFMKDQHINPREAVMVHKDLGAKRSIGVHWGTFKLSDEALDQPPKDLATERRRQGVAEAAFDVMAIGETRSLPLRNAARTTATGPSAKITPSTPTR